MSFNAIVGNNKVKDFLKKQISSNHVVHSYIFVGTDGIGKKLFAREFAKELLCLEKQETKNCISCVKWDSRKSSRFCTN